MLTLRWAVLITALVLGGCQSGGTSVPLAKSETCWWVHTCFITEKSADTRVAKVTLDYKGSYEPFTVLVRTSQSGMQGNWTPVQKRVQQAPETVEILSLRAAPTGNFDWRWRFDQHPGTVPSEADTKVLYRLPYTDGEDYEVIQGYGGTYSHGGDNFYSIDWAMPVGTPILAARGGLVVETRADSNRSGRGWDNHVLIRHDDGTYGWYLHLKQGGVTVTNGQTVKAGDLIGYSGNTGYSSRPHLHFQVSSVSSDPNELYRSFPTRFATADGIVKELRKDHRYRASPLP